MYGHSEFLYVNKKLSELHYCLVLQYTIRVLVVQWGLLLEQSLIFIPLHPLPLQPAKHNMKPSTGDQLLVAVVAKNTKEQQQ